MRLNKLYEIYSGEYHIIPIWQFVLHLFISEKQTPFVSPSHPSHPSHPQPH